MCAALSQKLDPMFKHGSVVEELDRFTQVHHLEYVRQWPITPR